MSFFDLEYFLLPQPECVICLDRESVSGLSPCGHKQFCGHCLFMLMSSFVQTCPLCRGRIESYYFGLNVVKVSELDLMCNSLIFSISDHSFRPLPEILSNDYFNTNEASILKNYITINYEKIKIIYTMMRNTNTWNWIF